MELTGVDLSGVAAHLPDLGLTSQGLEFEPTRRDPNVYQIKSTGNRQSIFFYTKEFYNTFKTQAKKNEALARGDTGPVAPVYEKKQMVRIVTPGDKSVYDSFAEEDHKRNYFRQYSAFRDGKAADMGTSLKDAEFVGSSELIELNYLGVYSIEQLADASDSLCDRLPRGYELRTAARTWQEVTQSNNLLDSTKKLSAELTSSQDMILRLSREAEEARREMQEMKTLLARMQMGAIGQDATASAAPKKTKAPKVTEQSEGN